MPIAGWTAEWGADKARARAATDYKVLSIERPARRVSVHVDINVGKVCIQLVQNETGLIRQGGNCALRGRRLLPKGKTATRRTEGRRLGVYWP